MSGTSNGDHVSSDLRAVESEVDAFYLTNPLVSRPFAEAAWYFLAFCEEIVVREIVRADSTGTAGTPYDYAMVADNLILHTKWPLRWLRNNCIEGGAVPSRCDGDMYEAAWRLSDLSHQYQSFESAFTYATLGLLQLTLQGHRIVPSGDLRGDSRYEAYDRLVGPGEKPRIGDEAKPFLDRIANSVRIEGDKFAYALNPGLVKAGLETLGPLMDTRFELPSDWRLTRYALGDFVSVARVLFVLAFVHFHARMTAARRGCIGLGFARSVMVFERPELLRRLRRYTGLEEPVLVSIVEDLTYGARRIRNPDPALQPLIPLTQSLFGVGPNLILNSSLERNFAVLLNRLPDEKEAYSKLSQEREKLLQQRIKEELQDLGVRFWHGEMTRWGGAPDIDLAIISDAQKRCLILELKSFLGPAEIREVRDRSKEIGRGIEQVRELRRYASSYPDHLSNALGIDQSYRFSWGVASETSVGAVYVQATDVPVVRTRHLLAKLRRDKNLSACCDWLEAREYLPVEGTHYKVVDIEASIADYTLEWYGIRLLVETDYV